MGERANKYIPDAFLDMYDLGKRYQEHAKKSNADKSDDNTTDGYAAYLEKQQKATQQAKEQMQKDLDILDEQYRDYVPKSAALSGFGGIANMFLNELAQNRAFKEDPMTAVPALNEVQFKSPSILPGYEDIASKSAIYSLNAARDAGTSGQSAASITANSNAILKEGVLKQAQADADTANAQEQTNAQLKEAFAGRYMQDQLEDARRVLSKDSAKAQLDLNYRQMGAQNLANLTQVANNAMIAPLEQQALWFEKYRMLPSSIYNKSANG